MTQELTDRMTLAEWQQAFGERGSGVEFRCPECGNVTSLAEWKLAGLDPQAAPQECIGRHVRGIGCDYAAYGLITWCRIVVLPDGSEQRVFPFADEAERNEAGSYGYIRRPQRFARLCAVIGYPDQQVIDALTEKGVDRETAEQAVEEAYSRYAEEQAATNPTGRHDPTSQRGVT